MGGERYYLYIFLESNDWESPTQSPQPKNLSLQKNISVRIQSEIQGCGAASLGLFGTKVEPELNKTRFSLGLGYSAFQMKATTFKESLTLIDSRENHSRSEN